MTNLSKQAQNSIKLFKGNAPSQIENFLNMQNRSVVKELTEYYGAQDNKELAIMLSAGMPKGVGYGNY